MLLRLAYLGVTNALAMLRLLPMSDRAKDAEILALRHQIAVLERQLHGEKIQFAPADRAFLAALLHRLPRDVLRHIRLLVRPETVLRWHRDLIARRHAAISRPKRAGRPPTAGSIRTLVLRLARENTTWGYRRIQGELLILGVKVAPSTVWEILKDAGIEPAPQRTSDNWSTFLRSQAETIIAADFLRGRHADRDTAVCPGRHRARHPPYPRPWRHRAADRGLGNAGHPQPRHGPRRRRVSGEVSR